MRFSCDKNVILKEISVAQDIITTRNALSILSNVLLVIEEDALTIQATDMKVSFETRIPVLVEEEGTTTVFCDKLLSILRTFPDGEVHFIQNEGERLSITNGSNITFKLHSIVSDKFPEIPKTGEDGFLKLAQKNFIDMISHTIFAISDDENRYYLNGVYLEKIEEKLVMVATDGRRLSYISATPEDPFTDFEGIIIPPKVLMMVRKLASGEGELKLAVANAVLFIQFDNQEITSTLIESKYPNYSRVIPKSHEYEIRVARIDLLNAIKRVSLLAEQKSKRVYFSITAENINLKSEESEVGIAEENISCEYDGPDSIFSINYLYIIDPLKVITDEKVCLKFTDSVRAIKLIPVPESDYFHIVMPMQKD